MTISSAQIFKESIEIANQKSLDKYGITLFDKFSERDKVEINDAVYRKIKKQKINKIFIGNLTKKREGYRIYISDIAALNWYELQMLNIRGEDALTKMVNLYNIFGYVLDYNLIVENGFGNTIIQREKGSHNYSSYIVEPSKEDLPKIERKNILKRCRFGSTNSDVQDSLTNLIIELEEWGINEKEIIEFIFKLKSTLTKPGVHALTTRLENIRKSGGDFMELYNFAIYLNLLDSTKGN